ncbi:MAG: VWA domain-containing protein [Trueperaceae bacterium]
MTFLQPAWFALLVLVPLVLWFHMRRREPLEVPSTRLWRLLAEGERPVPRWRRPPPSWALLLQVAAIAFAALAMAEPRLPWTDRGPTVLVVDASVAMGVSDADGRTRLDAAAAGFADELRRRDGPWSVWRVSDTADPIVLGADEPTIVRAALAELVATEQAPDWRAASERIAALTGDRGRVVVVAADPDAARAAFAELPSDGAAVEVRGVGGPFANARVVSLTVAPDAARSGRWTIDATIDASALDEPPTDAVISLLADGTDLTVELVREPLRFTLAGTARVRATVDAVRPGIVEIRIDGRDAFAADDARAVRIDPAPEPRRVAVVGQGVALDAAARAVEALGYERVPFEEGSLDVVVVAGAAGFLLEDTSDAPAILWLGTAEGVVDVDELPRRDAGIATWVAGHPLTHSVAWGRVDAGAAVGVPIPSDAEIVVAGVSGPLVASRTTATRREAWFAFEPRDAAWTASAAYLAAFGDALGWMAPPTTAVASCVVGAPCAVPREVATALGTVLQDGRTVARWPTTSGALPANLEAAWVPERSGIATWTAADRSGRLAVLPNLAAVRALEAATTAAADAPVAWGARWPEVRTWVMIVAVLLAVESAWAGLGPERFLRPAAWRAGGRLGRRRFTTALSSAIVVAAAVAALATAPWPIQWRTPELVVVGANAATDWPEARTHRVDTDAANPLDVEVALAEARAIARAQGAIRVLWAPDVGPTRGDLARALISVAPDAPPIDALPEAPSPAGDAAVVRLDLDRIPFAGDTIDLTAVVTAPDATPARLTVHRDGHTIVETDVDLLAGATLVRVPIPTPTAGSERWRVDVVVPGDPRPGNDAMELAIEVREAPFIWVVSSETERADRFAEALELQGLRLQVQAPFTLPNALGGYAGIDAVVLVNVPALEISTSQQEVLETWIRDRGGALAIAGGERAFGPGGYVETPLDRVAPLSAKVPREAPEVALLFVLDRSGSMQQRVGTATRLEIAKEATLTATELLGPASQVAVVVFDEEATVLLPWTPTADLAPMERALANLVPGGGTALYPGLASARDLLTEVDSATRHVVLMTDGLSQPGDLAGVTAEIAGMEATVSSVAIGQGADVERIREIARIGGGAVHVTSDFRALPGILAQEAMLLSGDPVVRERVTPRRTASDPGLMEGLPQVWPPLTAFVETTPKLDADVLLEDGEDRPLLAAWRYGAGRVLAFASQAVGPWSDAWAAVDAFPRWWGQWLRWTIQPTATTGLDVATERVGDALAVTVDARDEAAAPLSGLILEATWTSADGARRSVVAAETAPGRYVATLPIDPGAGTLEVADPSGAWPPVRRTVVHSYPASWAGASVADAAEIAAASGGRLLDDASELTVPRSSIALGWAGSWRAWLAVALVLYVATLATRYLPGWWRPRRARKLRTPAGSANPTRSVPPIAP